ncbi:hypothetical protein IT006_004415 [Escherichia coli]|uniref:hypothetical protein n=1 Tax=Escherichia coli TaxID=562 RepID=UPI000774FC90|nr:hypothetical protein [Escherichia coli]EEX2535333.1 hypothetical protein [Escherichia coli]EFC1557177.1 hypothetical protein [Escherichia coli]EFD9700143.1 hypothetical protein [Escherichia coli]EFE8051489.1 hypothetical protein [Escherichia coli]EFG3523867.1 hypothetical protein [Escherichia coli]
MAQNMPKEQRVTLITLATLTAVVAVFWFLSMVFEHEIKCLGPLVVSLSSAIPVFSLWWPFKPKYISKRIRNTLSVDLNITNHVLFGDGDYKFDPYFSTASNRSLHVITRYSNYLLGGAPALEIYNFHEIGDAEAFPINKLDINNTPIEQVVILKNIHNKYALIKINSINQQHPHIFEIEYILNSAGSGNFTECR